MYFCPLPSRSTPSTPPRSSIDPRPASTLRPPQRASAQSSLLGGSAWGRGQNVRRRLASYAGMAAAEEENEDRFEADDERRMRRVCKWG